MRQHNLIFDVEKNHLGIAHATCAHDPNQILERPSAQTTWVSDDLSCDHSELYGSGFLGSLKYKLKMDPLSALWVLLEFAFVVGGACFCFCCYQGVKYYIQVSREERLEAGIQ